MKLLWQIHRSQGILTRYTSQVLIYAERSLRATVEAQIVIWVRYPRFTGGVFSPFLRYLCCSVLSYVPGVTVWCLFLHQASPASPRHAQCKFKAKRWSCSCFLISMPFPQNGWSSFLLFNCNWFHVTVWVQLVTWYVRFQCPYPCPACCWLIQHIPRHSSGPNHIHWQNPRILISSSLLLTGPYEWTESVIPLDYQCYRQEYCHAGYPAYLQGMHSPKLAFRI